MSGSDNPTQVEVTLLAQYQQIKRRSETRYQCAPATAARLSTSKGHEGRRAWVLNLSSSGIGLLLDTAMEPDSQLVIHLQSSHIGKAFDLLARVVHSTPQTGGEWLVGCKLAEKLSQDDLEALL
jgi:hypothetical protein